MFVIQIKIQDSGVVDVDVDADGGLDGRWALSQVS